jgi:26S proteasome regulatory subunit N12
MSDTQTLHQLLLQSVSKKDYAKASDLLSKLKLALLENNALIPSVDTPPQALALAREVLEVGAVVSIHLNDEAAFLRYYAQLQPFYAASSLDALPSKSKNKIVGLYLLLLLTKNNIADFHTTLEKLPGTEDDVFVRYPVMLERWLMEGSYDKVWQATKSSQVPSEEYAKFSQVRFDDHRSLRTDAE